VIGISAKDRGAILPAGKNGVAYMYQPRRPDGLHRVLHEGASALGRRVQRHAPADKYFGAEWKPVLDDSAYARSLSDERKWYAKGGKLPKKVGDGQDKPGPIFYGEILATPFSDDLLFAFARAAIAGERLGRGAAPDILIVSLSAHDYINHAWGAESRLSQDHVLQLDRMFADFFGDLDQTVGPENYVWCSRPITVHARAGVQPIAGRDAGRVNAAQLSAKVNAGLARSFGKANGWDRGPHRA